MESLVLLPAVDVQNGQAVQLVQGVAGSEKVFGDPLAAAQRWQDDGAEWIHLVDLDAAFGRGSNADTIAEIVGAMNLDVELSGGIRDDASLERALATGCRRVNIGTAALENPDWCVDVISSYGDRIAIGEEVVITDAGEPVAKLMPILATAKKRGKIRLGSAKGEFTVPDDFNDPLPKEIEDLFW